MSKYPKLLREVSCQWELPSGQECRTAFLDMNQFTAHVREHVDGIDGGWRGKQEFCRWNGCEFTTSDLREFIHHVLFHPYRSFQKMLGEELREKSGLPPCRMDEGSVNVLPPLTVELRCLWTDERGETECRREFDSVGEFYDHVHMHIMSEGITSCRWKGVHCHTDR